MARVLSLETIKKKSSGCNPDKVKRLNLWGQRLTDISILSECPNLEILSLSYNSVSDITALKHCTALKELYLIKNNISSLKELSNLSEIKDLRILCIDENPLCSEIKDVRLKLLKLLPQLLRINNENVTDQDRELAAFEKVELDNNSEFRLKSGSIKINNSSIQLTQEQMDATKNSSINIGVINLDDDS